MSVPMTVLVRHRAFYETLRSELEGAVAMPHDPANSKWIEDDVKREVEYNRQALKMVQKLRDEMIKNVEQVDELLEIIRRQGGAG